MIKYLLTYLLTVLLILIAFVSGSMGFAVYNNANGVLHQIAGILLIINCNISICAIYIAAIYVSNSSLEEGEFEEEKKNNSIWNIICPHCLAEYEVSSNPKGNEFECPECENNFVG